MLKPTGAAVPLIDLFKPSKSDLFLLLPPYCPPRGRSLVYQPSMHVPVMAAVAYTRTNQRQCLTSHCITQQVLIPASWMHEVPLSAGFRDQANETLSQAYRWFGFVVCSLHDDFTLVTGFRKSSTTLAHLV